MTLTTLQKRQIVQKAMEAAEEGKVEETVSLFKEVQGVIGNSPAPFVGIATAFINSQEYAKAKLLLQEGLQRLPNSTEIKAVLALALHLNGDKTEKDEILGNLTREPGEVGAFARELMMEV